MNTFATIIVAQRFRKVTFYTVKLDSDETNLFLQFINAHTGSCPDDMAVLRSWLKRIGNDVGAKEHLFRFEGNRGDAKA